MSRAVCWFRRDLRYDDHVAFCEALENNDEVYTVFVFDTISPVLMVIGDPIVLWPPNHKYETFDVSDFIVDIWDNCPISDDHVRIFHATSDEPENSNGDGNTIDGFLNGRFRLFAG